MTARSTHTADGFFALRTPLLSFDELLAWAQGTSVAAAPIDDERAFSKSVEDDMRLLRERLASVARRPEIRQALFVASPSLEDAIMHWLRAPADGRGRDADLAFARYYQRMSVRCTPFGVFAGFSVGTLGDETRLSLPPRESYRTHTRLDMDYLFALCEALAKEKAVRAALRHRPNTSLYRAGGEIRYAEARLAGKARSYHLVTVVPNEYIEALLERARAGVRPSELVQLLVDMDPELEDEAAEFVDELIDSQVLVSDLTPPVTGVQPIHALIELSSEYEPLTDARAVLVAVRDDIARLDAHGLGETPEAYRAVAERLEPLPTKVELSRLFQVDMSKPATATLGKRVVDEVMRAVDLAARLARPPREDRLAAFRRAFTTRYQDREVPLLEVLDEESGIGFEGSEGSDHAPLLHGLPLQGSPASAAAPALSEMETWLLRRLMETGSDVEEIVLSDKDIEQLAARDPIALPNAFNVGCNVFAASEDAVRRGDFQLQFDGVYGPSGANMLGRFCHADPTLESSVRQHLRHEEACQPEAVFAEIVHLPEGRLGNILARPVLRDYEIAYLGRSGAPEDRVLSADDLLVSIIGGRVVLRSRRLGKTVIPRMTTAHNHSHRRNLNVYRFLAALQQQDETIGWRWSWGALDASPRLPRVRHGRLLLAARSWRLGRSDLESLKKGTTASRVRALRSWHARSGAPRFLSLVDADNELPIDFENVMSLEAFAHVVKGRPSCRLEELLPTRDGLLASGVEGPFFHEIMIPFSRKDGRSQPKPTPYLSRPALHAQRRFLPGQQWLYAKLYTGAATLDRLLITVVAPLVQRFVREGACDRWFFIRYGDPDWHLRLRFRGSPDYVHGPLLNALREYAEQATAEGRLHTMVLDSYDRELERYGGNVGIDLAEQLFQIDSEAVLEIIECLDGASDSVDARWLLTLRGIDRMLDDLGLDFEAKCSLVRGLRRSFGQEFKADASALKHQLGAKFRAERKKAEHALGDMTSQDPAIASAVAALTRRSERLRPIGLALVVAERRGELIRPLADLASSFVHMHANRLVRSSGRAHELVLHDFLTRIYESRVARAKTRGNDSAR
jgi:lantibiotic biosynthesis protein